MKLTNIRIEKFRGIREASLVLNNELALVGQNSGGKSSILRALNAFFNFEAESTHFESRSHSFQKTSTSIIDLEFEHAPVGLDLPRSERDGSNVRVRLKYRRSPIWEVLNSGVWETTTSDSVRKISQYIRYVYIPVERTDKLQTWKQDSLLQKAVHSWVKKHTAKRDTISPTVSAASRNIKDKAFAGLSKHLRALTHLNGDFNFEIDYKKQPDYGMLINDLALRVVDGSVSVDISDCGSGTQSLAVIGLYSYLAESMGGTYILGLEEPEQNLHPQAQRSLLSSLKGLPLQVIFTTHSTVMVDSLSHEEVALCRRYKSSTRGFEIGVQQLNESFWIDNEIDRNRYYNFHKRKNSEFFFADLVILCESHIDLEVISYLISDGGLDENRNSISLVSVDGVQSLPYIYHLLKELNIKFCTVVDKDYFLPYLNGSLEESRDRKGYPRYKKEFADNCIINDVAPSDREKNELLDNLISNHTKALQTLSRSNVFCFRWAMEIDLIACSYARSALYESLAIAPPNRNSAELLIKRKKQIKKLETVLGTIKSLSPAQLPYSYKIIRREIPAIINSVKA